MPNLTNKGRRFPHWSNVSDAKDPDIKAEYIDKPYRAVIYTRSSDDSPWYWKVFIGKIELTWGRDYPLPQAKYNARIKIEALRAAPTE